jgi:putative transposase
MTFYRGFPRRLHHETPPWVDDGALFHIRIATDRLKRQQPMTTASLGKAILDSVKFYEDSHRWYITLFVLMPDHLHGLISFPRDKAMSDIVADWKRYHAVKNRVIWSENYFDHRLRDDEGGEQLRTKMNYIRQNPVAAGLCVSVEAWPWQIDPFAQ